MRRGIRLAVLASLAIGLMGLAAYVVERLRQDVWSYDEMVEHTADRIDEVEWPPGRKPTAAELVGDEAASPDSYLAGQDKILVIFGGRPCAWWAAWRASDGDASLLAGLREAVEATQWVDEQGDVASGPAEQLREVGAAERGDPTPLRDGIFTRMCPVSARRAWPGRP